MEAIDRARADVTDGRAWKARDRLLGLLAHRPDALVAEELAGVHMILGDLPAAGALWFVTGNSGPDAVEAIAAWEERHGDAAARWRTIPRPLRESFVNQSHMRSLRADAEAAHLARRQRHPSGAGRVRLETRADRVFDVALPLVLLLIAGAFVLVMAIGLWTIWGWLTS